MNDDSRKVAFVTGASSGIGAATARAFVSQGYATALVDLNEEAGRQLAAEFGELGTCTFIHCDVSDDQSVREAVAATVDAYGRLDAAFNAAGVDGEGGKQLADCDMENWNKVIAIDLTGVFSCMRYQIPAMLASGGGSIVNCASVAGVVGAPYFSAYVAAKHGVVGLTRAAALDYGRQGIRVNAVCPGLVDTPMSRHSMPPEIAEPLLRESPIARFAQPEEIASAVLWLAGDGAAFVTGQALPVDGGWTAK